MREILFRGKRVDNGEWVEGLYIEDKWGDSSGNELHGILQDRTCPPGLADWIPIRVKKETVGQYTGLTDKNGKKIFEGDIVKYYCGDWDKKGRTYVVDWNEEWNAWNPILDVRPIEAYPLLDNTCEVIGNIFDNKELWEAEE